MKHLNQEQVDFYFSVYYPLLFYAFSDIKVIEIREFMETGLPVFLAARDHLYKNRDFFDEYIEEISKETEVDQRQMTLINNMKNARFSDFIAVEKNGLIYYIDYRKNNAIYQITGISDDGIGLYQCFPSLVRTAIFHFENYIVADGIIGGLNKKYPKNAAKAIIRDFESDFEDKITSKIVS
jgi:hypothetical protein